MVENKIVVSSLKDHVKVFHTLIDDCRIRRALFEVTQELVTDKEEYRNNVFWNFYVIDHLRSQFADLRKFFDLDSRVYHFCFITNHLENQSLKKNTNFFLKFGR